MFFDTRLTRAMWAKGIRSVEYHIHVHLSRKCNDNEDSSYKLYIFVTCHYFKKSAVNVDENSADGQIMLSDWGKKNNNIKSDSLRTCIEMFLEWELLIWGGSRTVLNLMKDRWIASLLKK